MRIINAHYPDITHVQVFRELKPTKGLIIHGGMWEFTTYFRNAQGKFRTDWDVPVAVIDQLGTDGESYCLGQLIHRIELGAYKNATTAVKEGKPGLPQWKAVEVD
jgi:hypothetical protein